MAYHKVRISPSGKRKCPVCNNTDIRVFLEAGPIPIHANLIWQKREDAVSAPTGDFHLGFCENCGHIFNTAYNPDLLHYSQWFENSLHPGSRFQRYGRLEIDQLVEKYSIQGKSVLEIGRGESQYALLFSELADTQSFIFEPCDSDGYTLFAGLEYETSIRGCSGDPYARYQPDLICCQQILEQLYRPQEFVKCLRNSVGERGGAICYFEVQNSLAVLKNSLFEPLSYETYSLFSPASLEALFTSQGFQILRQRMPAGEKVLAIEISPNMDGDYPDVHSRSGETEQMLQTIEAYRNRLTDKIRKLTKHLDDLSKAGKAVACWGATSRETTILNAIHAHETVQVVVDPDFEKFNLYLSGTGHRIVTPGHLTSLKPDAILIFDTQHELEIRLQVKAMQLSPEFITLST